VGWLGAVVAFLAIALTGLLSDERATVRGVYLVMEATGWLVLVPLSLLSLGTGLVSSLGTQWGLLRHYWVVAKLVINVFASFILVLYMQTLDYFADVAADTQRRSLSALRNPSPVLHAAAALALLLLATTLAIYKPRGLTARGRRLRASAPGVSLQPYGVDTERSIRGRQCGVE
jgi:hypothetical protein